VHRLPVNLVGYHQRVVAQTGDTFVEAFQQVLQHDPVWRIWRLIAFPLPHYVHGSGYHPYVLGGDSFDDIVENTDSGSDRYPAPVPTGVKDLVSVKFHTGLEAVGIGRGSGHAVQLIGQRNSRWPVH